ncbi:c-type cytochrome [Frateuria aurantia]
MNAASRHAVWYRKWYLWLIALMLLGWGAWFAASQPGRDTVGAAELAAHPGADLIERGRYLALAGDCVACHTAPHRATPFAGGLAFETPIGTIYSPNITPDPMHGIGRYSYIDFERAVRRGIRRDGSSMYPAMPYPSYARLRRADVEALYLYFMHGVPASDRPNQVNAIPWPLSMRWPLRGWRWLFADKPDDARPTMPGEETGMARGRYLVEGLGHCGACHTPRGLAEQEVALHDDGTGRYLSGGSVDHWTAPSLRNDPIGGLGSLPDSEWLAFLARGRSDHLAAFGGMREVVTHSTQYLTPTDLQDIVLYLRSLESPAHPLTRPLASDTAQQLHHLQLSVPGATEYMDNCAACHRSDGRGYPGVFPALAGNPVLQSTQTDALIHLVLAGADSPGTRSDPASFSMPAFADRLDDAAIARLASFVQASWGNQGAPVTVAQVRALRQTLAAPPRTSPP